MSALNQPSQDISPLENTYLSDTQLALRFSVSRATIWRWAESGNLPSPIKLSPGCTRWRLKEILQFENNRSTTAVV